MKKKRVIALFLASFALAGAFGCDKEKEQSSSSTQKVSSSRSSSAKKSSSGVKKQSSSSSSAQTATIAVSEVIAERTEGVDFTNLYVEALISAIDNTYNIYAVSNIDVTEATFATDGRIELEVSYRDGFDIVKDTVEHVGDTTGYEVLFGLGNDKEGYIADLLTSLSLDRDSQIEVDGEAYTALQNAFDEFDWQKADFQALHFTLIEENLPPENAPPEYVTVQSMVDQVFAYIDFNADLRETASTLVSTKNSNCEVKKLLAVDYSDTEATFIIERYRPSNNNLLLRQIITTIDSYEKSYFEIANDLDEYVEKQLTAQGLTLESEVDKNSEDYTNVLAELQSIKSDYETKRTSVNSTIASEILERPITKPNILTTQEMSDLGISNMNAFAEALQNNTKGEGYEQVTGWTMDDVLTTYVTDFGAEAIDYSSSAHIFVITKNVIYDYKVWTQRYQNSTENRYGMFLSDNPNGGMKATEKVVEFSSEAILFNQYGQRIA